MNTEEIIQKAKDDYAAQLSARTPSEREEERGDVGYYVSQTWEWLWNLYAAITPQSVINSAVAKFELRAEKGKTK